MAGCIGRNLHRHGDLNHDLLLAVVRKAVEIYGQRFSAVYRGCRGIPDEQRRIFYGSTKQEIAAWYGSVKVYRDVRGLLTYSSQKSVMSDSPDFYDYDAEPDEEVIWFP